MEHHGQQPQCPCVDVPSTTGMELHTKTDIWYLYDNGMHVCTLEFKILGVTSDIKVPAFQTLNGSSHAYLGFQKILN